MKYEYKDLISKQELQKIIKDLGQKITKDYKNKSLVILALADGGLMFAMDLIRQIDLPLEYYTCVVKSYGNDTISSNKPKVHYFPPINLIQKDVIIVDDIKDSGQTLQFLKQYIQHVSSGCKSVEYCVLFNNKNKENNIQPKYIGKDTHGEWLVGYGFDDSGLYRNIDHVVYREV